MKQIIIALAVIVLTFLLLLVVGRESAGKNGKNLDAFAQCLAEKKIIMYGTKTCSHCQAERNRFGEAFRFISYVDCFSEPQVCLKKGITDYPTWLFPDGRRLTGEQGLEKLSQESGCPLR